jgi:hypothetical protein
MATARSMGLGVFAMMILISVLVLVALNYSNAVSNKKFQQFKKSFSNQQKNFGVFANQAALSAVTGGIVVPWDATPLGCIPVTAGILSLPCGKYLVTYTLRLTRVPYTGTAEAQVLVYQSNGWANGAPTYAALTQPYTQTSTQIDTVTASTPSTQSIITGTVAINVTSKKTQHIYLWLSLPTVGSLTVPVATGTDANAQLVVQPV